MALPIEKILEDGVMAPSGENCQPWRFKVKGNILLVHNVPEADLSLYNSKQKGSYVAHGALIENISISAKKHGYSATITMFPNKEDSTHIATIIFEEGGVEYDPLYEMLEKRCTNRKDFSGETLTEEEKEELFGSIKNFRDVSLTIINDKESLGSVGRALAINERVLFENKKIHDFFYSHIIWDKKDQEKAGGFFIDTLEFLPHQLGAVKIFKNWYLLSFLNILVGVSRKISKENGEKYAKSGSMGAIAIEGDTPTGWVEAGKAMQRVWLAATQLGLAFHPCNGTIYFLEQIADGGEGEFSKKHSTLIKSAYKDISKGFNSHKKHIVFIFRIGRAEEPSARAKRLKPQVEFINL